MTKNDSLKSQARARSKATGESYIKSLAAIEIDGNSEGSPTPSSLISNRGLSLEKAYLRFGPTYFNEQEIAALEEKIGEHEFQNLRLKRAEFLKDADLNPVKSSPKFSLHITEINNSTDRFYTLAVKEFNLKERQVSAYESIEESGDCDPCEDYVWRLELIADSGMIDAEKSLSEETVEKLIGCSVNYARKVYFEGLFGVRPKSDSPRLSQ